MSDLSSRLSEAEETELRAIVAEVEEQLNTAYKRGRRGGIYDGLTLGFLIAGMMNIIFFSL